MWFYWVWLQGAGVLLVTVANEKLAKWKRTGGFSKAATALSHRRHCAIKRRPVENPWTTDAELDLFRAAERVVARPIPLEGLCGLASIPLARTD